jgi:ankyrin repeat protein
LRPVHIAILCGSHAIVELLLDGKANPNATGLNPLGSYLWV